VRGWFQQMLSCLPLGSCITKFNLLCSKFILQGHWMVLYLFCDFLDCNLCYPTFSKKVQLDWLWPPALWWGSTTLPLLETEERQIISSLWNNVHLNLCHRGMASLLQKIGHPMLRTWGSQVLKQTSSHAHCHSSMAQMLFGHGYTENHAWNVPEQSH